MSDDLQQRIHDAIANPKNLGEMENADSVGTVGSPDCGDMLRMWVKFKEQDGKKVIDRATFQTFGCETAIAVASVATELIAGKTIDEALSMSGEDLSAPLGALPPMKIHCAQLVEGALRSALAPQPEAAKPAPPPAERATTLFDQLNAATSSERKVKVVLKKPNS
ncbi:nitrogen-fixing NifU domain protein [Chthoniobacter flavus Ellin428]|uniref:Nitrogen-fixing NifU domain protein n=1 Tax=Chthoniobacter flavus Ellin428 TaxID=497964 RepID=B4CU97_9BACT|nr:iron-sulfur cluster scaffold-like protein [Chthoniobacter flavus]EDY22135.1 nitrogen-fixing NifU domain protein [Chthoniobacter flavus Ellin428]TCO94831.1 nitrogen fixation NifU-like protein [Chthoniobacter flavus]